MAIRIKGRFVVRDAVSGNTIVSKLTIISHGLGEEGEEELTSAMSDSRRSKTAVVLWMRSRHCHSFSGIRSSLNVNFEDAVFYFCISP